MSTSVILLKKPASILNRDLKINSLKELLVATVKGVASGVQGNYTEAGTSFTDAAAALGLAQEPGEIAWVLMRVALERAVAELLSQTETFRFNDGYVSDEDVEQVLDALFEDLDIEITSSFFDTPGELEVIKQVQNPCTKKTNRKKPDKYQLSRR